MADTNPFAYSVPPLEYAAEDDILVLGRGAGAVNAYARAFFRKDSSGFLDQSIVVRGDANGYILFAPKRGTNPFGVNSDRFEIYVDPVNPVTRIGNVHGGTGTPRGLALFAGALECVRLAPNGNVGIGTVAPAVKLHVAGQIHAEEGVSLGNDGTRFSALGVTVPNFGLTHISGTGVVTLAGYSGLALFTGQYERLRIDSDGAVRPGADNSQPFGKGSFRWSVVYAGTGTINTSDEREKLWIGILEDSRAVWLRIARRIFGELGFYVWRDAVEAKGEDSARWHFGARAQRVWAIVAEEGLAPPLIDGLPDPAWAGPPAPAFLCFDQWDAEHEEEPVYSEALVGEDGKPLQIATRTVVSRAAGNRFGFRVDQLGLLLDWSLHMVREVDRMEIEELHARVAVLEGA